MAEARTFRLRVRHGKAGRLSMLSHLEITHALERLVRRSGLPFALSQGFSPHMKIAFGPALPVGVGGTDEVFDVTLTAYVAPDKALSALKASAPFDLMPQACTYVEPQAPAASVAFPVSSYEVCLSCPLESMRVPESVTLVRKGKEKELRCADFLEGEPRLTPEGFTFALRSKETGSLRADAFASALLAESCEGGVAPAIVSVTRCALSA